MITLAKRENLHARRQVLHARARHTRSSARIFDTIAARFAERHGGYTRIIKAGVRRGDAAPVVFLELVDRPETPKDGDKKADKKEKAPRGEQGRGWLRRASARRREKAAAASA